MRLRLLGDAYNFVSFINQDNHFFHFA